MLSREDRVEKAKHHITYEKINQAKKELAPEFTGKLHEATHVDQLSKICNSNESNKSIECQ